jgi:hypothetical protein
MKKDKQTWKIKNKKTKKHVIKTEKDKTERKICFTPIRSAEKHRRIYNERGIGILDPTTSIFYQNGTINHLTCPPQGGYMNHYPLSCCLSYSSDALFVFDGCGISGAIPYVLGRFANAMQHSWPDFFWTANPVTIGDGTHANMPSPGLNSDQYFAHVLAIPSHFFDVRVEKKQWLNVEG